MILEPISKSPEEDNEAGELNKAQVSRGIPTWKACATAFMSSRMHRRPVRINLADTPRRNDNGHGPFDKLDRLVSRPQRCTGIG